MLFLQLLFLFFLVNLILTICLWDRRKFSIFSDKCTLLLVLLTFLAHVEVTITIFCQWHLLLERLDSHIEPGIPSFASECRYNELEFLDEVKQ